MPVSSSMVGFSCPPVVHDVDARWLMAYAAGIGDSRPALLDTSRPEGIAAHPLFTVCVEWPAVLAVIDAQRQVLSRDERLRSVHATHDVQLHRPIRPGDRLTTTPTVVAVERRRPGAYQVMRLDTVDSAGNRVATTYMGVLFLGVAVEGPDVVLDPAEGGIPAPLVADDAPGETHRATLAIPATAGHVYTECARIWNPIHTDAAVATEAGLPGPVLHGTATLAMAISAMDRPLTRVSCRFRATVAMPSTLTLEWSSVGDVISFEVRDDDGRPTIDRGVLG